MASKTATTTKERIGRVGERRQVVIPRDISEKLNLRKGDVVAFVEKLGGVLVKRQRMIERDDTLTAEEAKIVRRGEAQLRRGNSKPWRTVKNELAR